MQMEKKIIFVIRKECPTHGKYTPLKEYDGCLQCHSKTQEFISKAKSVHGDKYDYSKSYYVKSAIKLTIICKFLRVILQIPNNHLRERGCYICGVRSSKTTEEFIKKAMQIHKDRYDYSKVEYVNNIKKVAIICKVHGDFKQMPINHLSDQGCPMCVGKNKTTEQFVKEAAKIHGGKYDYSKVEYVNSRKKVVITCQSHGSFMQSPNHHLGGSGCPMCAGQNKSTEQFIKEATKIHGGKYDYSKVEYVNSKKNVMITCQRHGSFMQSPNNHLKGQNCPKCQYCSSCQLFRTKGKKCEYCIPLEENKHYRKTKEMEVVQYLRQKLPDEEFIHNKSVGSHCTNQHLFPDIRFELPFFHLIVEVDEHQHRGSTYTCEEKRMCDIVAKLGLPCVFIRYNPDNKESNKDKLVEKIQYYLNIVEEEEYKKIDIDKIKSYKVEYMHYT